MVISTARASYQGRAGGAKTTKGNTTRFHGNYCGPNWSDGKYQSSVSNPTAPAISEFDNTCKEHDIRYATASNQQDLDTANQTFYKQNIGRGITRSLAAVSVKYLAPKYEMTIKGKGVLKGARNASLQRELKNAIQQIAASKNVKKPPRKVNSMQSYSVPVATGTTIRGVQTTSRNIKNGLAMTGRVVLNPVQGSGGVSVWDMASLTSVHPAFFNGSILGNACRSFQKFKYKKIVITFITSAASTTSGDIIMTYNDQITNPSLNTASSAFLNRALSANNVTMGPLWVNQSFNVGLGHTEPCLVDAFSDGAIDENFPGEVAVYVLNAVSGSSLGFLLMDFDIEFYDAFYTLHSTLMPITNGTFWNSVPFTSYSATPTAGDATLYYCASITSQFSTLGNIYKCVFSNLLSAFGTSRTAANAFKIGNIYGSTSAGALNTFTTNISIVGGTVMWALQVSTTQLVFYSNFEAAYSGSDSAGEIYYQTTGSTADSLYFYTYLVHWGSSSSMLQS